MRSSSSSWSSLSSSFTRSFKKQANVEETVNKCKRMEYTVGDPMIER